MAAGVPAVAVAAARSGIRSGWAPGIRIWQDSVDDGTSVVATFRWARCRLAPTVVGTGQRFIATASDNGYRLEIYIDPFAGFHDYPIHYESDAPLFLVRGPHGPFSNTYMPVRTPRIAGGVISFSTRGSRIRLHFANAFNVTGSDSVILAGGMSCGYQAVGP
jgi:hypothetical protein